MVTNRLSLLSCVLFAGLCAALPACTSAPTPAASEPVAAVQGQAAAPAAAPLVTDDEGDTIAAAAVADIDPNEKTVEDVQADEVNDDDPDDVPPAPTGFGASLVELRVDSQGDPESLWVAAKHAAVHAGPSTKAETVGSLLQGDRIDVLERKGEFVRIGDDQWVSAKSLTDREQVTPAPRAKAILAH